MSTPPSVPLRLRIKAPKSPNSSDAALSSDPVVRLAQLGPDLWMRSQATLGPHPTALSYRELAQNCPSPPLSPLPSRLPSLNPAPLHPTVTHLQSPHPLPRVTSAKPPASALHLSNRPSVAHHQVNAASANSQNHPTDSNPTAPHSTLDVVTHCPNQPTALSAVGRTLKKTSDDWTPGEDAALWKILRRKGQKCSQWGRVEKYMHSLGYARHRRACFRRAKELREEWLQGKRPEWSNFPNIPAMVRSKSMYAFRSWTAKEEDVLMRCLGRKERMGKNATLATVEKWMAECGFQRSASAVSQRLPKLMKNAERDGETWTERLERYVKMSDEPLMVNRSNVGPSTVKQEEEVCEAYVDEDSGWTDLGMEGEGGGKDSTTSQLFEQESGKENADVDDETRAQNGKREVLTAEGEEVVRNRSVKRARRREEGECVPSEEICDIEDIQGGGKSPAETTKKVDGESRPKEIESPAKWTKEEDLHLMTLIGLRKIWRFSWNELIVRHHAEGGYNRTVTGAVMRAKKLKVRIAKDGMDWEAEVDRLGRQEVENREGRRDVTEVNKNKEGGNGVKQKQERWWGRKRRRDMWVEEEDTVLRQLVAVKAKGQKGWLELSAWMRTRGYDRTAKACQLRWSKLLECDIQEQVDMRSILGKGGEKLERSDNEASKRTPGWEKEAEVVLDSEDVFYASLSESESDEGSLGGIEISAALGEISRSD